LENRRLDDTVSAEAEKGEIQEREEAQTLAHEEALAVAEDSDGRGYFDCW
jgi:hypothetical protein